VNDFMPIKPLAMYWKIIFMVTPRKWLKTMFSVMSSVPATSPIHATVQNLRTCRASGLGFTEAECSALVDCSLACSLQPSLPRSGFQQIVQKSAFGCHLGLRHRPAVRNNARQIPCLRQAGPPRLLLGMTANEFFSTSF
jgi:hypothetical protein